MKFKDEVKVVVFDIWSDYGHFRKYYTTTSPLTFSIPPPPAIAGILGAIYGTNKIDGYKTKNTYLEVFGYEKCHVAVRILNPIQKVRIGINLLDTKQTPNAYRTQIRTEFLWRPRYRIYVAHENDEILNNLTERLQRHEPVYTVCMGLAYLLANFQFVGIFNGRYTDREELIDVVTAIPIDSFTDIKIEEGKRYLKERIPVYMNPDRVVKQFSDVIFEPDGKSIKIKPAKEKNIMALDNGENIAFL